MADGRVIFTSDTVYPVLTGGAGDKVDIVLRPASASVDSSPAAELAPFPAVFEGTLPCADCPGIHYRLTLAQDGTYTLHRRYEGRRDGPQRKRPVGLHADGWTHRTAGVRTDRPNSFRVATIDRLEKLDQSGQPIDSKLGYALMRQTRTTRHALPRRGFSAGVLLAGHAEEPSMALVLGIPASHGPANKTPALKPRAQWRD